MKNEKVCVRLRQVGHLVHDCQAEVSHDLNLNPSHYDDKARTLRITRGYKLL